MLDTNVVQVTGRGTNVNFVIDDSAPFEAVAQGLHEHLTKHRSLYSKGSISVNVGRRILEREELTQIKQILEKESGVTVSRFWCSPNVLEEALSESIGFGVAVSPSEAPQQDDAERSRSREERRAAYQEEAKDTGLEQWIAYVLDRTTAHESPQAANEVPAEAQVAEDLAADEVQDTTEKSPELETNVATPEADIAQPSKEPEQEPEAPVVSQPVKEVVREARPAPAPPVGLPTRLDPRQELVGLNRGNEALLIKTTCRSGEVVRYPGDVVVLADVNPGAEIIADGDILVFGNLRGLAHAGASGDVQATIIAMNLDTHRLQIGPFTGVAPKSNKRSKSNTSNPRIALVRRRAIYVAPYAGRFAGYSGGTLYDG